LLQSHEICFRVHRPLLIGRNPTFIYKCCLYLTKDKLSITKAMRANK